MAVAETPTTFECPACSAVLEPIETISVRCPACGWRGRAWLFTPLTLQVEEAVEALPDDAVCIHHPTKRAVAICEGTGDYICALCSVELKGKTYSVQFLDRHGRDKLNDAFDRYVDRPDRTVASVLLLSLFFWPVAILTVPLAIVYLVKMFRLRESSELYARIVTSGRSAGYVILTVLFAVLGVLFAILVFG